MGVTTEGRTPKGIPERLVEATIKLLAEQGPSAVKARIVAAEVPVTVDPIADLFTMALTTREIARSNPHLYDLMFGLSTRATYRPVPNRDLRRSGRSQGFRSAYAHFIDACVRLVDSGRVGPIAPAVAASALWSFVHGYVTLELGEHFADFDDPVTEVLLPMGVTFSVGLGDTLGRAVASHQAALELSRGGQ